jgi:predicted transcriptional regulator
MNRLLWYLIAGTKGGVNRARIIKCLQERPYNANQIAEKLNLDYKTVRHHIKVLEDNNIIVSSGDKYGTLYFLSSDMENNLDVFEEIWNSIKD